MKKKTREYVLSLADPDATLETAGGKGASLARLMTAGLPVPDGFHVTTSAYRHFVTENSLQPGILDALETVDVNQPASLELASLTIRELFFKAQTPPEIAGAIAMAYAELAGHNPIVAVRSSATAEDLPEASFAGQQESYLNVDGYDEVLKAVKRCWASLWTARAIGYRARQGIGPEGLSLAVVVQALVPAEAAGILFTANPVSGQREQAMISAAWGLGEAIVGGLVTPDTLILNKTSGVILERQVAEKGVMTTCVHGGTEEQPVPADLRLAPVLDDESAAELVQLGVQIEQLFGMPMDIEWAMADGVFYIVQARPITALPEPVLEPPSEWPMPDPKGPYMRGSIADFMPKPLTPLFSTLSIPAFNAAMERTMKELIGGTPPMMNDYLTTINDYAYLHLNLGFRDWMWVLFRMGPALPRLLRNCESHWRQVAHPRYTEAVDQWSRKSTHAMSAMELLDGVKHLTAAVFDYLTALQIDTLGTAAGTEGLFTIVYNKLVRGEGDPQAATLLLGSDSLPIQAEKDLYDLAQWCRERSSLADFLTKTSSDQLAAQLVHDTPVPVNAKEIPSEDWKEWQKRFRTHLARYGYSIYDLDFARPLPADEPQPMLETLKMFIRGEGTNPHERQRKMVERRDAAVQTASNRVKGLKLRLFRWTLRWAQTFVQVREDSIFEIGLGYPVLRRMLGELGQRFVKAGAITDPDDIYWLNLDEVERYCAGLDRGEALETLAGPGSFGAGPGHLEAGELIEDRKRKWHTEKLATPPQQLPEKARVMGIKADAFLAVSADEQAIDMLKGVAASPGKVTALARVLHGTEDFVTMQPGDILVAEITTPAWTPLFAMAAGIVTDVGGPLSHGSIVAREYGIPAVLGTGVATQRIHNGQKITVDGSKGIVTFS